MVADVVSALAPQAQANAGADGRKGSTVVVELSDEDLCLVLARTMAKEGGGALEKKCIELAGTDKAEELINELLGASAAFLAQSSSASDKDRESGACILAHAIAKLASEDKRNALADKLCKVIIEAAGPQPTFLSLSMLMQAYNAFRPRSVARYACLLSVLRFGASVVTGCDQLAHVLRGQSEAIVAEYEDRTPEERRILLLALASVFSAASRAQAANGRESSVLLTQYLASLDGAKGAGSSGVAEQVEVARRLVRDIVASPDLLPLDFIATSGMLEKVEEGARQKGDKSVSAVAKGALSLARFLVESDVRAMAAWVSDSKNAAVLAEIGITGESCVEKVRLVAIAELGAQASRNSAARGEVTYAQIAESLDVPAAEVEVWLIKAIGLKVVEGRMDQVNQSFQLQRCTHKLFGNDEWSQLNAKCTDLEQSMSSICDKLESNFGSAARR